MKTTQLVLLSAFCFTQAHSFTLPRHPVKSYDCDVCARLSHEKLQDKWEISNEPLNHVVSNTQKSYSYKERVSLEQLRAGITITTTAPGAIVRITPLQDKLIPQLKMKTPDQQTLSLQDVSALYSQDEPFGDKLLSVKHQTMLQIKPELGSGKFILKSDTASLQDADSYLINVYDKFSPVYMEIGTDSLHYQYGDKVTAKISLVDNYVDYDTDEIEASLIGPSGQNVPLKIRKLRNNQFEATATLTSEVNDHGENWYLEANVQTDYAQDSVKRYGHTAFSYSIPSASLLNVAKLSSKPLTFVATIDVATASRYALQSVLYRKSSKGEPIPMETSQRAQWLEAGKQVIQFTFDNSHQLSEDNLYLGYLRLTDYGQLKTVYQYNQPIKLSQLVE